MAVTLDISSMRYSIQVQQKVVTRDSYGAETITYVTTYTLKAGRKYLSGTKGIDAEEIFAA